MTREQLILRLLFSSVFDQNSLKSSFGHGSLSSYSYLSHLQMGLLQCTLQGATCKDHLEELQPVENAAVFLLREVAFWKNVTSVHPYLPVFVSR